METSTVVEIVRRALMEAFWVGFPLLLVAFVIGALVSLVQIMTSIQDASFATLPKLGAILVGLLALLPWMISRAVTYTTMLFADLGRYAR
jgi:flagellar biosynthesis protein FliQ